MTTVFLERFRLTFEKHDARQWHSPGILHYILGGNQHLAQALCCWRVDNGPDKYTFPYREVTLDDHHKMTHGDVVVNIRDIMRYLAGKVDRADVRDGRFVKHNWASIAYLATLDTSVDVLGDQVPDKLRPLFGAIWCQIAIHSIHQQRCEQYVQLTRLISITGVGRHGVPVEQSLLVTSYDSSMCGDCEREIKNWYQKVSSQSSGCRMGKGYTYSSATLMSSSSTLTQQRPNLVSIFTKSCTIKLLERTKRQVSSSVQRL